MAAPSEKKRLVHHLDTPFSTSSWPEISPSDQDVILRLLCHHLRPIGQHRKNHVKVSKGKRASKKEKKTKSKLNEVSDSVKIPTPPSPELGASVDVGFNSITKNLASIIRSHNDASQSPKDYSMIFVVKGSQSQAFNQHFPRLVAAASRHRPENEMIRLIGFSIPCSKIISSALGIPMVSSVAISRHAPDIGSLLAVVLNTVTPVDSPWQDIKLITTYQTTRIGSVETTIGTKRDKRSK